MQLKPTTFTFFRYETEWWMHVTSIEQLKYILNMDYIEIEKAAENLMNFYLTDMTPEQTKTFLRNTDSVTSVLYTMYNNSGLTIGEVKDQLFNNMSKTKVNAFLENHFINVNSLGGYNICDWPMEHIVKSNEPIFPKSIMNTEEQP